MFRVPLGRRNGSRVPVRFGGSVPKTAGSLGSVMARWRGGVLGRGIRSLDVDCGVVCVSARLSSGSCFGFDDAEVARGAGVGEIVDVA